MAVCPFCQQEMLQGNSCICIPIKINNILYIPIKYGEEGNDWFDASIPCHDCGVTRGGYHHPGCDVERCPKCGGQLISCDCDNQLHGDSIEIQEYNKSMKRFKRFWKNGCVRPDLIEFY